MKLDIKYTRLGNKFFFISNLSEWHFSCRKKYNRVWLEKTGPVSKEEKKYLEIFSKILKKYNFKNYLGVPFMVENKEKDVWKKVSKIITGKEYSFVQEVFNLFDKKFNRIWEPHILEKNSEILKREFGRDRHVKINSMLQRFFRKNNFGKRKFGVYLLKHPSDNNYIAGGANLGIKGVTIEANNLFLSEKRNIEKTISVIYHELIHMFYGKNIRVKIRKIFSKEKKRENRKKFGRPIKDVVEEIIICTLFPSGFIANKFFSYKPYTVLKKKYSNFDGGKKFKEFNDLRNYIIYKMYPEVKRYTENKKRVDSYFIKKILNELK